MDDLQTEGIAVNDNHAPSPASSVRGSMAQARDAMARIEATYAAVNDLEPAARREGAPFSGWEGIAIAALMLGSANHPAGPSAGYEHFAKWCDWMAICLRSEGRRIAQTTPAG